MQLPHGQQLQSARDSPKGQGENLSWHCLPQSDGGRAPQLQKGFLPPELPQRCGLRDTVPSLPGVDRAMEARPGHGGVLGRLVPWGSAVSRAALCCRCQKGASVSCKQSAHGRALLKGLTIGLSGLQLQAVKRSRDSLPQHGTIRSGLRIFAFL